MKRVILFFILFNALAVIALVGDYVEMASGTVARLIWLFSGEVFGIMIGFLIYEAVFPELRKSKVESGGESRIEHDEAVVLSG